MISWSSIIRFKAMDCHRSDIHDGRRQSTDEKRYAYVVSSQNPRSDESIIPVILMLGIPVLLLLTIMVLVVGWREEVVQWIGLGP